MSYPLWREVPVLAVAANPSDALQFKSRASFGIFLFGSKDQRIGQDMRGAV
jgi:hypothetical protein